MTTKLNPGKPDGGETPTKRCPICNWPIVPKTETGCWEGNCAYRPHEGTAEYYRIKKRREELAAPSPQPSAEATEPEDEIVELREELRRLRRRIGVLEERLGEDSEGWR